MLLSSSCDVLSGNSAIPDYGQLSYPFRKAIVIEEIRWTLRCTEASSANLGALVLTKMQLGQKYLMRDAVPIWLLGTSMTRLQEQGTDTGLTTTVNYSHYRWRLPEPLYLEAGQVLAPVFSRGADGFPSINVQVSYVGRTVPPNQPRPVVIPVPYAASFVTTSAIYEQSNEKHLFNPFDVPIRVQRFTGRVLEFEAGTSADVAKKLTPAPGDAGVTIQIFDSWGGKVVPDRTGPSDVFDSSRAAWTVDTILPPKGVYEVRVWDIGAASERVHIAMIGVREEKP